MTIWVLTCVTFLSWLMVFLRLLMVLIPVALVTGVVVLVIRKSWRAIALLLLISPPGVSALWGVVSYVCGTPHLLDMGLPGLESWNPDRVTRCYQATGGDLVYGGEWVVQTPNNLVVTALSLAFGPARHCYDGPYPTREEAEQVLKGAAPTPIAVFVDGKVQAGKEVLSLDKTMLQEIVHGLGYVIYEEPWNYPDQLVIRSAIFHNRCLVLCLEQNLGLRQDASNCAKTITLIDLQNRRPFAYYRTGPVFTHRQPVSYME